MASPAFQAEAAKRGWPFFRGKQRTTHPVTRRRIRAGETDFLAAFLLKEDDAALLWITPAAGFITLFNSFIS